MPTTTRGFRYPGDLDPPDVPLDLQNLAEDVDGMYSATTFALRPAAAKIGRIHRSTDTGLVSLDTGSSWIVVGSYIAGAFVATGAGTFGGNLTLNAGGAAFIQRSATAASTAVFFLKASADAQDRFTMDASGTKYYGGGAGAADLAVGRSAAATFGVTGSVTVSAALTVSGNVNLAGAGSTLGFFNSAGTTKKTGYGAGVQIGSKAALSAASTLNDVIGVLSSLIADLRGHGLIGS